VRERVPYSAYLFYKWAGHPGTHPDAYGEALDPAGIVAQAHWMLDTYGFGAIKLKGGVFEPTKRSTPYWRCARHSPTFPYGSTRTRRGAWRPRFASPRAWPGCSSISRIRRPLAPG